MRTEQAIEYTKSQIAKLKRKLEDPTSSYGDYAIYGEHLEYLHASLEALEKQKLEEENTERESTDDKLKGYNVSIAVDGRIDVCVRATSFGEAKEKAFDAFANADISQMEVIGFEPVNAECEDGEFVDY